MNIQFFGTEVYDEIIENYNQNKNKAQEQINNLAVEKQNVLDSYEKNYQNQLAGYENLMTQQQQNIDTWANTQKEQQQKQTDYNIGLIEQNKQEAQKQADIEKGNAYIDYQKGLNQFGGSAESLAAQGLGGTGFAKNQEIAMNITYQNRVSAASSALQKANTDYDNQIQQALLTNDAALAEVALQQMQQSYALALKGFEYKSTMENNRLNYLQNINDSYFNKQNTLQSRLDTYNSQLANIKTSKLNYEYQLQKDAEAAELERQQAAAQAARYSSSGGGSRSSSSSSKSSGGYSYTDNSSQSSAAQAVEPQNAGWWNDSKINAIANLQSVAQGMSSSSAKVKDVYGTGNSDSNNLNMDNRKLYTKNGSYYVFDTGAGKFVKL